MLSQLSRAINVPGRNKLIVESYQRYGSDRKKTIAFCADVQHAKDLAAMFNAAGIPSAAIHGKMDIDERRNILQAIRSREIRVLTNCGVLTEGFDSPQVDSILLCRPTRSPGLYVQCVGRGTRVSPGKAIVLSLISLTRADIAYVAFKLLKVLLLFKQKNAIENRNPKEEIDENFTPSNTSFETSDVQEIDFFGRSQFAWVQVGDAWHLPFRRQARYLGSAGLRRMDTGRFCMTRGITHPLSSHELPLDYSIGIAEDWVRNNTSSVLARKDAKWRTDQPSEKQLAALAMFGIRDRNLTKGDASDLLRIKFNERSRSFTSVARI